MPEGESFPLRLLLDLQAMQSESGDAEARRNSRSLAKALIAHAGAREIHILLNERANTNVDPFFAELSAVFPPEQIHVFRPLSDVADCPAAARWRARAAALIRDNFISGIAPDLVQVLPSLAGDDAAREARIGDLARDAINALEHNDREREDKAVAPGSERRPRMAFVSPLPGDRSGIATYSAELLPELARHYEIECIVHETVVNDEWVLKNTVCRDTIWFERNALDYDRILYCVGNSRFHAHMFPLMLQFPGAVILHDIFLGDLVEWMAHANARGDEFDAELYRSHGPEGLALKAQKGVAAVIDRFQLNGGVFRNAVGVIVHSVHAANLVKASRDRVVEEGLIDADLVAVVPHFRAPLKSISREDARARLGIAPGDFVVASFGLVTRHKLGRLLCEAWRLAGLQTEKSCRLVFVGGIDEQYGEKLRDATAAAKANIFFTDHASAQQYTAYCAAADAAVQLRAHSRGETSGALLDGMAAGLPVICNAHGSFREFPEDCVLMLGEAPHADELAEKLRWLFHNRGQSRLIGERAQAYVERAHDPKLVGMQIKDAVERFYGKSPLARQKRLLAAIAGVEADTPLSLEDRRDVARCIAANERRFGDRHGPYHDPRHIHGIPRSAAAGSRIKKVWARVCAAFSTRFTAASDMRLAANDFDEAWYLERNPDVATSGIDPLWHFMRRGYREGRWPTPQFDPAWYLAHNLDVTRSGMNPFVHFIKYGRVEGRLARAPVGASGLSDSRTDDVLLRLDLAIDQRARRMRRKDGSDYPIRGATPP